MSKFNRTIHNWDIYNVNDMSEMFAASDFSEDISNWNVEYCNTENMFNFAHHMREQNMPPAVSGYSKANWRHSSGGGGYTVDDWKPQIPNSHKTGDWTKDYGPEPYTSSYPYDKKSIGGYRIL